MNTSPFAVLADLSAAPPLDTLPAADEQGWTPLHFAVLFGHFDAVEALLAGGAKPNAKSTAIAHGRDRSAHRVLNGGGSFYLSNRTPGMPDGLAFDKGTAPLHIAARQGHVQIVELLLTHKARATLLDGAGATPLHHAALDGHSEAVQAFLGRKPKLEAKTKLKKSVVFYDAGVTALHCALEGGDWTSIEALLSAGADPTAVTARGCDAVFFAARGGTLEGLAAVLSAGVSARRDGVYLNFPMIEAVRDGNLAMVQALIEAGAPFRRATGHEAALREATERNQLDIRQALLDAGAVPLEHKNPMWAARANDATWLRETDMDLCARYDGDTPLMQAAAQGHLAAVEVLLERGAHTGGLGQALHWALDNQRGPVVDRLLAAGVDCTTLDPHGNTVLFRARDPKQAARMVELGADPHLRNSRGVSAIKVARNMENAALIALYEQVPDTSSASWKPFEEPTRSAVLEDPPADATWKRLHGLLWDELVPPRGECRTVQGELIRCIGRLTDEAYRNGNINWGDRHRAWVTFIETTLCADPETDTPAVRGWCQALRAFRRIDTSGDGSPHYRLNEAVVAWCLRHPRLVDRAG